MINSIFVIESVIILYILSGLSALENNKSDQRIFIIEGGGRELNKLNNEISDIKNAIIDFKTSFKNEIDEVKNLINDLKEGSIYSFEEQRKINESGYKELLMFDQRYDPLPQKCANFSTPKDCAAATLCTQRSGIYKILNEKFSSDPFFVNCDAETEKGDWLIIQRRQDGSVDFYRSWDEYENGFGDLDGEFFIGLKKLHFLTNNHRTQELLVIMEDNKQTSAFAKYDTFAIGNAKEFYALKKIGKYSGNAGDALQNQIGMKFTTKDRDNDLSKLNCAQRYRSAWWYKSCMDSNLMGNYNDHTYGMGVNWDSFRGPNISLTYVKMMIRNRRI